MKAIIITFEGDIKDEQMLANACMVNIRKLSNANEVSVSLLSDKEIAEILVKKTIILKPTNSELNVIHNFCNKIIENIGPIPLKTREIATREICRFLVSQNNEVIVSSITIIARINSAEKYKEHREVLETYGLSFLPQLLRDVNPVFKFY